MSFEADLVARLRADAAVAGLVGTRIYWKIRPQSSELPAIVLSMVFGARTQGMAGAIGTQGHRVQFDCMASPTAAKGGKDAAVELREAVQAVIESSGTQGGTTFQGGFVNLFRDDLTDTAGGGQVRAEQVDATIWFN